MDYILKKANLSINKYKYELLANIGIGFAAFFLMISQNLVNNYDGMWWFSNYKAGSWERSIGRWVWPFLDKMRFGVVSIVLNSFLTFLLIGIANIMILNVLDIRKKQIRYAFMASFLMTPLVCDLLSYCYMSPTFGAAYLFSVIAAFVILNASSLITAIGSGAVFVVLTMGCYQAYIGVTCVVVLFGLMFMLLRQDAVRTITDRIIRFAGAFLVGGIAYKLLTSLMCILYDIRLDDYNGAADVSVFGIIRNFPRQLAEVNKDFMRFFLSDSIQKNYFGLKYANLAFLILAVLAFIAGIWQFRKRKKSDMVLYILAFAAIPTAANIAMIIAYDSHIILQMEAALILLPGLILCLYEKLFENRIWKKAYLIFLFLMIWINVCIVQNDQLAMREGLNASVTIGSNAAEKVIDSGYMEGKRKVAFVGRPSANRYFLKSSAWKKANGYAQVGEWWLTADCNRHSWQGIIKGYCGINFTFCSDKTYNKLLQKYAEELAAMPCYPEDGFMKVIHKTLVVKISNEYVP